jgi:hypothetical protein
MLSYPTLVTFTKFISCPDLIEYRQRNALTFTVTQSTQPSIPPLAPMHPRFLALTQPDFVLQAKPPKQYTTSLQDSTPYTAKALGFAAHLSHLCRSSAHTSRSQEW